MNPAQANPRKTTVKRIEFSNYGDKIFALNMEGSLFIHSFDLGEQSKVTPLFKSKGLKLSDFAVLDSEGVVAAISNSNKTLTLLDTLIQEPLLQLKGVAGNLILADPYRQKLMTFNSKPGVIAEHDLRKDCAVA